MRRNALQLSRRHKAVLYASTLLVFASGVAWWILDHYAVREDEFGGIAKHPAETWMLKIHGAAAMVILVVLGTLIPIHVKRGWEAGKNLPSGTGTLLFFGILTVTGYGLYYVGDESLRGFTSNIHFWGGVVLPLIVGYHVWRGHWLRRHGRLRPIHPANRG
jgi:hypothetical protein